LADIASHIPGDALAFLKGTNIQAVSDDVAALAREWGLDQLEPGFADPLGEIRRELNLQQGVDFNGDAAIYLPNTDLDRNEPPFVVLIPLTDYDDFLANFQEVREEDGVQVASFAGSPDYYVADWGDYAAMAVFKDIVMEKPEDGMDLDGVAGDMAEEKDLTFYANFAQLGPMLTNVLEQEDAEGEILREFASEFDNEAPEAFRAYKPVIEAGLRQGFNVAKSFLRDADAATISLDFDPEFGIGTSVVAQFSDGSYLGDTFDAMDNTDDELLTGLPDGKYLMFAGSVADTEVNLKLFDDLIGPVVEELREVDAAGQDLFLELVDLSRDTIQATEGQIVGLFAPAGPMQGAILQQVSITRGDADKLMELTTRGSELTPKLMSTFAEAAGAPQGQMPEMAMTVTPDAKTVQGVSFTKVSSEMAQPDPMTGMVMNMVFGPEGQTNYMATVDGDLLAVGGLTDTQIATVVDAVRDGGSPLSDSPAVSVVADQLPDERSAVVFVNVAELARSGLAFAQAFNAAPPVNIPENLPAVGVSVGSADNALEINAFIPKDLVSAMIITGLQVQGGGQGGPGGGL
jgi:hypothetical protein